MHLLLASGLWLSTALADGDAAAAPPPAPTAQAPAVSSGDLPLLAQQLRKAGVPEAQVREALQAAQRKGLSADDAATTFGAAVQATEQHGPIDNFGAFVQARLEEGLRGRELAEAIHAEHAAHGKGRDGDHGKGGEHGKPDDPGSQGQGGGQGQGQGGGDHGKSDDHGASSGQGKAGGHGKAAKGGKAGGKQ